MNAQRQNSDQATELVESLVREMISHLEDRAERAFAKWSSSGPQQLAPNIVATLKPAFIAGYLAAVSNY